MKYYEGKTVDSAVTLAANDLNVAKEDLIVTVIEEGVKGILRIGSKKAKIGVEIKGQDAKRSAEFLDGLFDLLKIPAQTEYSENDEKISINVITTSS